MKPRTAPGKWSLWLIAGFFVLFIFTTAVVIGLFHQRGGNTLTDNLLISIPMLIAFGAAVAALITGIVSVWRYQERSPLVAAAIIFGFLVTAFVVGELILSPG